MPRPSTVLVAVIATVLATAATSAIQPAVASAAQAAPTQAAVPLRDVVAALPVATELRDGYERTKFKHWVDADRDGCNTRAEVLLAEAATAPTMGEKCAITGGSWYSAYDDTYITNPRTSDIDHMVPLAEAWDSGAYAWTPEQRQAYANDLDEPRALIAVTATTNRSKADQDPHQWLPPYEPARCEYITSWTI